MNFRRLSSSLWFVDIEDSIRLIRKEFESIFSLDAPEDWGGDENAPPYKFPSEKASGSNKKYVGAFINLFHPCGVNISILQFIFWIERAARRYKWTIVMWGFFFVWGVAFVLMLSKPNRHYVFVRVDWRILSKFEDVRRLIWWFLDCYLLLIDEYNFKFFRHVMLKQKVLETSL